MAALSRERLAPWVEEEYLDAEEVMAGIEHGRPLSDEAADWVEEITGIRPATTARETEKQQWTNGDLDALSTFVLDGTPAAIAARSLEGRTEGDVRRGMARLKAGLREPAEGEGIADEAYRREDLDWGRRSRQRFALWADNRKLSSASDMARREARPS